MAPYKRNAKRTFRRRPLATKAKVSTAVKKYVKSHTPKPEVKRAFDVYSETTISAMVTPYQIYEPIIAQGVGRNQRIGNQIKMLGVHTRAHFKNNSTGTCWVRMLVLSTAGDTDTAAATMELFKDVNAAGDTNPIVVSGSSSGNIFFSINDAKFKTHYDHVYKLGGTGSLEGRDVILFNKFCKFNTTIKYDGTNTGLGNQSRRFLIIYLTSETALDGGGASVEISGMNRWYYIDP